MSTTKIGNLVSTHRDNALCVYRTSADLRKSQDIVCDPWQQQEKRELEFSKMYSMKNIEDGTSLHSIRTDRDNESSLAAA